MPSVSPAGHDHHGHSHNHDRHDHAHHHAPRSGAVTPPATAALSTGRWSLLWWGLGARLMLGLALVAIVWVTILWALF